MNEIYSDAQTNFENGRRFVEQNDFEAALEQFDMAIEKSPFYPQAYYYKGWVLSSKFFKYEESIDFFKKSIEQKNDYYLAYYQLGIAYSQLGRFEESITELKTAIDYKKGPFSDAYYSLGYSYEMLGQYEESVNAYAMSLQQEIKMDYVQQCITSIERVKKKKAFLSNLNQFGNFNSNEPN